MSAETGPRRRILIWLALIASLGAMPLGWWRSSAFRVTVYEWVYPVLSVSKRRAIVRRLEEEEDRPDLAWTLRLTQGSEESRNTAWWHLRSESLSQTQSLPPGLDHLVLATALGPRSPIQGQALEIAAIQRLRDPRLAPLIRARLETIADASPWLGQALGFVGGDPEAARRSLDRALDRLDLARKRFEGQRRSSIAGVGDLGALKMQEAQFLLKGYAGLGSSARASAAKIRRWRGCGMAVVDDAAALALWRCAGDREALDHLMRRFEAAEPGSPDEALCARNLVLAGEGAAACQRVLKNLQERFEGPELARCLWELDQFGLMNEPLLQELTQRGDPPVAAAARRILEQRKARGDRRAP